MKFGSLAVIGGTVVDVIFRRAERMPSWPDHSEFTARNLVLMKEPPLVTLGGNGANAAYVAAACGAQVILHTALAPDALGHLARRWLESVGCRIVARPGGATGVNVTAADRKHRRATLFHAGAGAILPRLSTQRERPGVVLVCGWPHPPAAALAREFRALRSKNVVTSLDPGPLLDRFWTRRALTAVLAHTDLLLINLHELCTLTGASDLESAVRRIRRGFSGDLVVKQGAQGACWIPAGSMDRNAYSSPKVAAQNTIGAGDTFNGALLAARLRGANYPTAIRSATRQAAKTVASRRGVVGASRAASPF